MEEGEFYAIETFGSTGRGHVREDLEVIWFDYIWFNKINWLILIYLYIVLF